MRLAIVLHLTGVLLRLFGAAFLAPLCVALWYDEQHDAVGFAIGAIVAVSVGHVLKIQAEEPRDLRRVEGMAVVAMTWLLVAIAGAIPYWWVDVGVIDGLFEAMSGLTTTGATTFGDFSRYGRAVFFWRALTHWLGGLGVIALFVAILPRFAIAGRQLFFAEAPGPTDEKLTPQIRRTAAALWLVYIALTVAQIVALALAGMSVYDAVCHAMATLAAGGFSPHPNSIQGYNSPTIEWIVAVFMFLAGANFALQYRVARGQPLAMLRDEEFRVYTGLVLFFTACCTYFLWNDGRALGPAVRHALFQVLSLITTTGFASDDFQLWNDQAKMVLLTVMFIGGCAGSAAGGPKVVRQILIARYTLCELKRTLHPRAVLPVKLGGRAVPDEVMRSVLVFFLFYMLVFAICSFVVVLMGADLITGLTASIATLGNIGPGFGTVGPMSNFGHLHPVSKVVLTAAMWIGRLEVMTVLAILRPEVWITAQWKSGEADMSGRLPDDGSDVPRTAPAGARTQPPAAAPKGRARGRR